jgi:phosphoglucosamine mutase
MSSGTQAQAGTRRLFGTDGIRGVAGEFPLDNVTPYWIGRALGDHLRRIHPDSRVILGQDTRESGERIAETVANGLVAAGVEVSSAGVVPTPAVAYLARARGFAAGVVISASHNPYTDNGIKVFSGDGYKLPDQLELSIEQEIFSLLEQNGGKKLKPPLGDPVRSAPGDASLRHAYEDWLVERAHHVKLRRLRLVVDCANGAASAVAPEVFGECGVHADFLHYEPDGRNINAGCGALHPEVVARAVVQRAAEAGITFDGDADRCLLADASGRVINGDAILLLAARDLQSRGELPQNVVVATTMSNMGLEIALKASGIRMLRAPVGDKYVLEEMQKSGAALGGEQSGHIIFAAQSTTGDGLLTALHVLEILARTGKPLAELVADLKVFPQTIQNVRVREKPPLEEIAAVRDAIAAAERELEGRGRVVVRYSGTEPLARVMIEAETEELMRRHAGAIAGAIQEALGA